MLVLQQQEIPCKVIPDKGRNALGNLSGYQSCQVNIEAGRFGELNAISPSLAPKQWAYPLLLRIYLQVSKVFFFFLIPRWLVSNPRKKNSSKMTSICMKYLGIVS